LNNLRYEHDRGYIIIAMIIIINKNLSSKTNLRIDEYFNVFSM